jgi:uncharacterized protein HemX
MRTLSLIFCVAILAVTASGMADGQQQNETKQTPGRAENRNASEQVFACSLTALNDAQRARHKELTARLRAAVKGVRELRDGYAFSFQAEPATIVEVAEWLTLERRCCPFFTFRIEVGSDEKPAVLEMTGPEGVKQFMQQEFNIKN